MLSMLVSATKISLFIIWLHGYCSALSTDFVLLGCNGNLAQKYLFQSLHDISAKHHHKDFRVHASTRRETVNLDDLLDKSLKQPRDSSFRSVVSYVQLKFQKDYEKLCASIPKSTDVIVFYLSIPPYAFSESVRMISSGCAEFITAGKVRVIIEKPFGRDLPSAMEISMSVTSHLPDNSAYRIDHYLGKDIVREILPFRAANKELNELIFHSTLAGIEVSMMEKLDCKGRSYYYDRYGVIRDVMQNHMTEMLLLSTLTLPSNISDSNAVTEAKILILQALSSNAQILLGQYNSYADEVNEHMNGDNPNSQTPTFAAVSFSLNAPTVKKVPIVLISGKKLPVKASYLRMIFKRREPSSESSGDHFNAGSYQEVIFYVGGDLSSDGFILCSKGLNCRPTPTLLKVEIPEGINSIVTGHSDQYEAFRLRDVTSSAYTNLLSDAIQGRKENFLSEKHLVASWRFWDEILVLAENIPIRRYSSWKELRFVETNGVISWTDGLLTDDKLEAFPSVFPKDVVVSSDNEPLTTSDNFHIAPLHHLSFWLAKLIYNSSVAAIRAHGSFHIALPGGTSLFHLFLQLRELKPVLDWDKTHVWMTDERCVERSSEDSNLNVIDRSLLRHVSIPYSNVHTIPLGVTATESCASDGPDGVNSAQMYDKEYRAIIKAVGGLDFAVLGVGHDGHVASLFPGDEALNSEHFVTYGRNKALGQRRVTMTLKSLLASKDLAVFFTGERKAHVASQVLAWSRNETQESLYSKPVSHLLKHNSVRFLIDKSLVDL